MNIETIYFTLKSALADCKQYSEGIFEISLAGQAVRIHCGCPEALEFYAPALWHIRKEQKTQPRLNIYVIENQATVDLEAWKQWLNTHKPADRTEPYYLFCSKKMKVLVRPSQEYAVFFDLIASIGIYWHYGKMKYIGTDPRSFLVLLHWFLAEKNIQILHAAAIAKGGKAALLVGRGGSGKSTTALAALSAGLDYLSDDYLAVDCVDENWQAHSLYCSSKVSEQTISLLPYLQKFLENAPVDALSNKRINFLDKQFSNQLPCKAEVAAIILPEVKKNYKVRLVDLSAGQAHRALAPSTICQLPGASQSDMTRIGELCRAIPAYGLKIGNSPFEAIKRIKELLSNK